MRVPALIMAGGKGKRLRLMVEKPLAPFLGIPLIEWVVEALESAEKVSDFYVVTSENTLETEKKCLRNGWKVLRTDGKGYHDDLRQAILSARLQCPVLIVSSDLPALTGKFLDRIISVYEKSERDALTVLVPVRKREELKLSVSSKYDYNGVAYAVSGVNLIAGTKILERELNQCVVIAEEIEAVLNVNTLEDLDVAEKSVKRQKKKE